MYEISSTFHVACSFNQNLQSFRAQKVQTSSVKMLFSDHEDRESLRQCEMLRRNTKARRGLTEAAEVPEHSRTFSPSIFCHQSCNLGYILSFRVCSRLYFSQSAGASVCVCLTWTGTTTSLMGLLTVVPAGAGASTESTPSLDREELMCCRSTSCGSLKERAGNISN